MNLWMAPIFMTSCRWASVRFSYEFGLQVTIISHGIESIRKLENLSAPILIALSGALLAWAYVRAGGFGPMLSAPSQFIPGGPKAGQFWQTFFPALTANVGFWATLSLNISGEADVPTSFPQLILVFISEILSACNIEFRSQIYWNA